MPASPSGDPERRNHWDRLLRWFAGDVRDPEFVVRWMGRWMAVAGLALLAATWRLWTPQTVFPQVPLVALAGRLPEAVEWLAFAAMIGSLAVVLVCRTGSRCVLERSWFVFAAAVGVEVLIDQHRLQPWAYQFAILSIVLASVPAGRAVALLRLLAIGIYFHSALSKLDAAFLSTGGQQLAGALLHAVELSLPRWSPAFREAAALALPLGELTVAVLLCLPRCRKLGLAGATAMHVSLLLALGPWGLDHEAGVLLWNAFFLGQAWLLWGGRWQPSSHNGDVHETHESTKPVRWNRLGDLVVIAAVTLPFLEPFGGFDHWPAWAVYASRPERVIVFVREADRDHFPEPLRRHVAPRHAAGWCRVRLGRWSLDVLKAPIYPQGRFRLGVAWAIAERDRLGNDIRVVLQSPANRWTGKRRTREVRGADALERELDQFLWNARPR